MEAAATIQGFITLRAVVNGDVVAVVIVHATKRTFKLPQDVVVPGRAEPMRIETEAAAFNVLLQSMAEVHVSEATYRAIVGDWEQRLQAYVDRHRRGLSWISAAAPRGTFFRSATDAMCGALLLAWLLAYCCSCSRWRRARSIAQR